MDTHNEEAERQWVVFMLIGTFIVGLVAVVLYYSGAGVSGPVALLAGALGAGAGFLVLLARFFPVQ